MPQQLSQSDSTSWTRVRRTVIPFQQFARSVGHRTALFVNGHTQPLTPPRILHLRLYITIAVPQRLTILTPSPKMSSTSTSTMEQSQTPSRPHSSSLSSLRTLREAPTSTSSLASTVASRTYSHPQTSTCSMHTKLSKQMHDNQQRWHSWQAKQLETFHRAVEAEQHSNKGFTAKRPHLHGGLEKLGRGLRKLRG